MPYRKYKPKKYKPRRFRRRYKPRYRTTKISKYNLHHYTRYAQLKEVFHTNTAASTGAAIDISTDYIKLSPDNNIGQNYYSLAIAFSLYDTPSVVEFSNLYDSYRIKAVKVNLYPMCSQGIMFGNGTLEGMLLHYVKDTDDVAAFTADSAGLSYMKEHSGYRTIANVAGLKKISIFMRPKPSLNVYRTTTTYGSMEAGRGYIDFEKPDIPHYGLKLFWEHQHTTTDASNFYWKMEIKYWFECKDVR